MRAKTIVLLLAAAFSPLLPAGEIYKCVGANGSVSYTNLACPKDSQAEHVADYEKEAAPVRSPQIEAEAAQAAAISARLADQAAADARRAAQEAEQAAYHEQFRGEGDWVNYASGDNQLWYPTYPYYGWGVPILGDGRRHRHDGDHNGNGGNRPGGGKPGRPKPTPLPRAGGSVVRN